MALERSLKGQDAFVDLTRSASLKAPGVFGRALVHLPQDRGRRSEALGTAELDEALAEAGWAEKLTVVIEARDVRAPRAGQGVRAPGNVPGMELQVAAPEDPTLDLVLLLQDEAGVLTWQFPLDERNQPAVRSGPTRTFRLPQAQAQAPEPVRQTRRSLAGAFGTKVLKVLAYPVADLVGATAGRALVAKWEQARRPYRLRSFTPQNYNQAEAPVINPEDWRRFDGRRALLFIHGTFSRAHSGFGALPAETMAELHQRYEGRVFAFDHFTLAHSPAENVEAFLAALPEGVHLDLDIICHSRGGLVARTLAEAGQRTGRVQVHRTVFVATPNSGTDLADADHMVQMLNRYTTLLNLSRIPHVGQWVEAILLLVKLAGHGLLAGLPGLEAMDPKQGGVSEAPGQPSREYYGIAADFDPRPLRLEHLVQPSRIKETAVELAVAGTDAVIDDVFRQKPNDLVVPTDGVFAASGSPHFPLEEGRMFRFDKQAGVMHTTFFGESRTAECLLKWLGPA